MIFSPINQISSGIGNLLHTDTRKETGKQMTYSAIMKKEVLANNTQINNIKVRKKKVNF